MTTAWFHGWPNASVKKVLKRNAQRSNASKALSLSSQLEHFRERWVSYTENIGSR